MTLVKFITKDRMLRDKENRMFTNKVNQSIIWGGKGKDGALLFKSLINVRVCKRYLSGTP